MNFVVRFAFIGFLVFVVDFGGQRSVTAIRCNECEFDVADCEGQLTSAGVDCGVGVTVCKTTATGRACGAVGETADSGSCITAGTTCCVGAAAPCNGAKKGAETASTKVTEKVTVKVTKKVPDKVTKKDKDKVTEKVPYKVTDKVTVKVTEKVPGKVTEKVTERVQTKGTGTATNKATYIKALATMLFQCYICKVNLTAGIEKRCVKATPETDLMTCGQKINNCRLKKDTWGCGTVDAGACKEPDCCKFTKCNIAGIGPPKGSVYSRGDAGKGSTSEAATAQVKLALILLTSSVCSFIG